MTERHSYPRANSTVLKETNSARRQQQSRSDYITARDQSMVESGVTEGGKNTASFLFRE